MVRLSDLVSDGSVLINDGYRTKSDELGRPGIPILRVGEVRDGHLVPTFGDHVREEFRDKIGTKTSQPGDVVVTTKGTVGRIALVKVTDPEFVYSPQVCFVRVLDSQRVNPDFIYQWFRGSEFTEQAFAIASQTDMAPYINLADFKSLRVSLPPFVEQRAIADVLGALDDKIESNRRIVRDVLTLIPLEIQLVENEEWLEVGVSEIADFVNGGAFTKDASGSGRMVIRIAELNNGPGLSTVYNEIEVSAEKTAHAGDILMAWSGSLGVYYWTRPEAIINQHIFKVVCKKYPSWLVFDRLLRAMPEFKQTAADKATTMGHIKRHHLDDTKVRMPESETLRILDRQLAPIWDRLMSAELENHSLETLRGALLPELLSGRLRVKDADSFMECV
jgi:type I restriction enzyme, S subunit